MNTSQLLPTGIFPVPLLEDTYVLQDTAEHENLTDREQDIHASDDYPHHVKVTSVSQQTRAQPPNGTHRPNNEENECPCPPPLQREALLDQRRGRLSRGFTHARRLAAKTGEQEWVTAKEAAALIGRHVSQVYRWIDAGRLAARLRADGVTVVLSKAVLRIEPSIRRGRPRGSGRRR